MSKPDFSQLAGKFGWPLKRLELLEQAFTHRSYLNEHLQAAGLGHNERLEFLGDAVLELAVTEFLFQKYPAANEGVLTAYRSALVNTETLAETASELGLNDYLRLSKGEARDTGRARAVILANTFESLIGALFLDLGYQAAADFIAKYLLPRADGVANGESWQDAKSFFQELAQARLSITPHYQVLSETGPDHDKVFTVGLYLGEELAATGQGPSKQRAEQEAASQGLKRKDWNK